MCINKFTDPQEQVSKLSSTDSHLHPTDGPKPKTLRGQNRCADRYPSKPNPDRSPHFFLSFRDAAKATSHVLPILVANTEAFWKEVFFPNRKKMKDRHCTTMLVELR